MEALLNGPNYRRQNKAVNVIEQIHGEQSGERPVGRSRRYAGVLQAVHASDSFEEEGKLLPPR